MEHSTSFGDPNEHLERFRFTNLIDLLLPRWKLDGVAHVVPRHHYNSMGRAMRYYRVWIYISCIVTVIPGTLIIITVIISLNSFDINVGRRINLRMGYPCDHLHKKLRMHDIVHFVFSNHSSVCRWMDFQLGLFPVVTTTNLRLDLHLFILGPLVSNLCGTSFGMLGSS